LEVAVLEVPTVVVLTATLEQLEVIQSLVLLHLLVVDVVELLQIQLQLLMVALVVLVVAVVVVIPKQEEQELLVKALMVVGLDLMVLHMVAAEEAVVLREPQEVLLLVQS
jgi:hypothetical protein